ncbi:DinB family protein [Paenibacillus sp. GCM10023248]|uniref:DinB family protein n=1 Tax=unclassified Paenibacillus TaxID=185978 RepID=UPI002378C203|nr:DinB family protein [Paenibacillus sp. MAHUQ-63]MDD9271121.1 DinB family protein [Paenibacillus sp. MAHUQ-63]
MGHEGARLLLQVDDLQASIAYYTARLGWTLLETGAAGHAALMHILNDYRAVLIERGQPAGSWLLPKYTAPKPGDLIYLGVPSVNEVERDLLDKDFGELKKEEDPGHIRKLIVPDLNGYTWVYWEELAATDEEIAAMYADGPGELERVVAGLTAGQLGLSIEPGKWTIREHVLHVVDLEQVAMHKVKYALAEPGRSFQGNSFSQDDWCAGLDYRNRPIRAELLLFRAMREHILGLCEHLPDALQRSVITQDREETVAKLLKMMAGHALHHIRTVQRIRELHNC